MRIYFTLLAILIGYVIVAAQTELGIPSLVPPTFDAYKQSLPIENYKGSPSGNYHSSVTLHTVEIPEFSLPLTLNYESGVQVNAIGGATGMSWTFSGGGVISRVVRGFADEKASSRWLPSSINPQTDYVQIKAAAEQQIQVDTQYDWFNFSVSGGISGSFYLDAELNPIYKGDDFTIVKSEVTQPDHSVRMHFTITDKFGTIYSFGGSTARVESTVLLQTNNSSVFVPQPKPSYDTAWYLYKIETPRKNTILFDYVKDSYQFDSSVWSSLNLIEQCACDGLNGPQYTNYLIDHRVRSSISGSRLTKISTSTQSVTFQYNKIRADATVTDLLTSIEVKNKFSHTIKNQKLSYYDAITANVEPYYYSTQNQETRYRYFLSQILDEVSGDQYNFEYYNLGNLPPRFSLSSDYYGYFNSKSNLKPFPKVNALNTAELLEFKSILVGKVSSSLLSANKEVNPSSVYYGNLKKITYPTKGTSTILYEANSTVEKVPTEVYSTLGLSLHRACEDPTRMAQTRTIVSNGAPIYFEASVSTDYYHCGEPDPLHETYGISVRDLSTGQIIWSKNLKASESSWQTNEVPCNAGMNNGCPVPTVAGRSYEIEFFVSSRLAEIYGSLWVKYNKTVELLDTQVNQAGSRVASIIENNGEGSLYTKKFYYTSYAQKNQGKTSLTSALSPVYYYIRKTEKNCYYDCGCYSIPEGPDRTWCFSQVNQSSGPTLQGNSIGYMSQNLFNFYNNREDQPYYTTITTEIPGKEVIEDFFFPRSDPPALTIKGPALFNLPHSNASHGLKGLKSETKMYELISGNPQLRFKEVYQYDATRAGQLKAFVFQENYKLPPMVLYPDSYIENISIAEYYNHFTERKPSKITCMHYESGTTLKEETQIFFESSFHFQRTRQTTLDVSGRFKETFSQYAHEKNNTFLLSKNILGPPLHTTVSFADPPTTKTIVNREVKYPVSVVESQVRTSGLAVPYAVVNYDTQSLLPITEFTYDLYDPVTGNLLQFSDQSKVPTAVIWGYHATKPIALVEGAIFSQVESLAGDIVLKSNLAADAGSENSLLQALDTFRNLAALKAFRITTYTHHPLIGVSSRTPPSGQRVFYRYNTSNRLEKTLRPSGHIEQEYHYHFKP